MSIFSGRQLRHLNQAVDEKAIYRREKDGKEFKYIAAWYAISEANRIFGHGGWDRETVLIEKIFEKNRFDVTSCAYIAKVKITVHGPSGMVSREGTGFGHSNHAHSGEAHEKALKSAETDATKRALATFGSRFGLSLYQPPTMARSASNLTNIAMLTLVAPDGKILSEDLSPEAFLSGFQQLLQKIDSQHSLAALIKANISAKEQLAADGMTAQEKSYIDAFDAMLTRRKGDLGAPSATEKIAATAPICPVDTVTPAKVPEAPSVSVPSPSRFEARMKVDKSVLSFSTNRRIRNKVHLDLVGSKPCLICEETGCHAHHITYAQPRGLSVKVSDEFTVPLCALHHNQLHQSGSERSWWTMQGIDPLQTAENLWEETLRTLLGNPAAG